MSKPTRVGAYGPVREATPLPALTCGAYPLPLFERNGQCSMANDQGARAESQEPRADGQCSMANDQGARAESREPTADGAESQGLRGESQEPRADGQCSMANGQGPTAESQGPRLHDAESQGPRIHGAESQGPVADFTAQWPPWATCVDVRFLDFDRFDDEGRLIHAPSPLLAKPWDLVPLDDQAVVAELIEAWDTHPEPWDLADPEGGEG
jgi:hypothetical protein